MAPGPPHPLAPGMVTPGTGPAGTGDDDRQAEGRPWQDMTPDDFGADPARPAQLALFAADDAFGTPDMFVTGPENEEDTAP